jgi:hypothetical protein
MAGIMRLLNVQSLQLETVDSENPPPYIIASHTWSRDEPTLQTFNRDAPNEKSEDFARLSVINAAILNGSGSIPCA